MQHPEKFRARHDNQLIEPPRKSGILELMGKLSGEGLDLMLVRIMLAASRVVGACATSAGLERCMVRAATRAIRYEVSIVQPRTRIRDLPRELQAFRRILQIIEKSCALICDDDPDVHDYFLQKCERYQYKLAASAVQATRSWMRFLVSGP